MLQGNEIENVDTPETETPELEAPAREDENPAETDPGNAEGQSGKAATPAFILYTDGEEYGIELSRLISWVNELLVPVYGRETSSVAPWCSRWWEHAEAVAQLHGLSLAWQELTGPEAPPTGPASWHRDFLSPVLSTLRDPSGPFAGCKDDSHRVKEPPRVYYPEPW